MITQFAIHTGSFCQVYRVTDGALIAETAVWPNFFLMNIFFALKGSKLFIFICCLCSWMLCRAAAVKSLPALIYSADYILLLVLRDHGIYSESLVLIIRLDSFLKKMKYFGIFRLISVFETTAILKIANLQYIPPALFARSIGSLMRL